MVLATKGTQIVQSNYSRGRLRASLAKAGPLYDTAGAGAGRAAASDKAQRSAKLFTTS